MLVFFQKNWWWFLLFICILIGGIFQIQKFSSALFSDAPLKDNLETKTAKDLMVVDPWKEKLTDEQYTVLRKKGTEIPYTSVLLHEKRKGTYYTVDTKLPVFRSEDKFDSGTGWPSFTKPISPDAVQEASDTEYGMTRTEILSTAGGHLGHVFTDGPEPTGLRYCMNGVALYFVPDGE